MLAAALLQIDDWDEDISDRLREDTPLFGSSEDAERASDDLRDLTAAAYLGTALIAPVSEQENRILTKAKLIGSEWATVKAARFITSDLKDLSGRERPNALDKRSFPSGHTTTASVQAQMATLNISRLQIGEDYQRSLSWSVEGMAALTGWARVEAGMHYPTDVLVGWTIGYFTAHLAQAFILPESVHLRLGPTASPQGFAAELEVRF